MSSVGAEYYHPNPYKDWGETESDVIKIEGDLITFKDDFISKLVSTKKRLYAEVGSDVSGPECGSIYTGSAGLAMLELFNYLDGSIDNCQAVVGTIVNSLGGNIRGNLSFLTGKVGPIALAVIAFTKLNDLEKAKLYCDKLVSVGHNTCMVTEKSDEILYGRAGYLYALLLVKDYVPEVLREPHMISIRKTIDAILGSGKKQAVISKSNYSLKFEWHLKEYLGAAHGYAGILHNLLLVASYLRDDEKQVIKSTIDDLLRTQYPSLNFPSSMESKHDRLVQWCHGAPGFVDFMCRAFKVYNDVTYLNIAIDCGEVIWKRGILRKGYSLCHGVAGNGYSFLTLFQTTKDMKYLHRACKFAEWCFSYPEHTDRTPDHPISLYEGIVGVIFFLEHITNPENAAFPGYALPLM